MVLIGADAEALYPNLQKEISARLCAEEIISTDIDYQYLDWKEMCRYLYLNMTEEQHREWKVIHWIPVRLTESGDTESKLTMHSKQVLGPHPPKEKEWIFRDDEPTNNEKKMLLAACMYIVIKLIFSTHTYSFGGVSYLQTDGSPIGLRVVNPIAKIRIAHWLRQVLKILENIKVKCHLVKSYIDDIRWLLDRIEKGMI